VPRVDLHAHVITPRYGSTLTGRSFPPQTVDGLRRFMDGYEIDAAVVSMGGALQSCTADVARLGNEELAELVRAEPSRFGALAIVPFTTENPGGALAEIEYALGVLGLDGVALFSNHHGAYLGEPAWEEVFAELDRRHAYAFVHPAAPPTGAVLARYPPWLFEYPFDTTRALANLIYSGTLERYPRLRLQFAHLGGAAPFLAHRLASLAAREPEQATEAPAGALAYLGRQWYDTGLSNNRVALASTLEVAMAERVVFGSDWPYLAPRPGRDPSDDFELLDPDLRARIDGENAAGLVPRLLGQAAGRYVGGR
jgi:predicted TIM-barrel fold metal-dependent hydrolase